MSQMRCGLGENCEKCRFRSERPDSQPVSTSEGAGPCCGKQRKTEGRAGWPTTSPPVAATWLFSPLFACMQQHATYNEHSSKLVRKGGCVGWTLARAAQI